MADPQDTNTGIVPPNPFSGGVLNPALIKANFTPPQTNVGQGSSAPVASGLAPKIKDMIRSGQTMGDQMKSSITDAADYGRNEFYYATPRSVNKDDFERYYEHPAYNKLGYSPWRDNEKMYNDNSSGWADFRRAAAMWPSLVSTGFKSGFRSWGDLIHGRPFKEDIGAARDFQRIMQIGSSSRGGFSGFMTNTLLNSGYTFGVMGEMLAEEIGLAATTALSGGTTAEATVPAMGARALSGFSRIGKAFEAMRGLTKAVTEMRDINTAKNFWNVAHKTGEFLNPLTNTTKLLKESDNLKNLATGKLFGAFYRDVRDINFSLSEAKLEGGSAYLDEAKRLGDDFYTKNGRTPNAKEQQDIMELSKKAAYATTLVNLPVIYYTNKITFDNLFKGFRPVGKMSEEFVTAAGSKIGFNAKAAAKGLSPFSVIESNLKNTAKALINPKTYAKAGLNYFRGNLSEGLQENLQDVISGSAKDYYTSVYNNPGKQGIDSVMGDIGNNMIAAFSKQGLETFMGGFVMGSLVHPVTALPTWTSAGYYKFFKPQEYAKYRQEKAEYTSRTVDRLNDMYKDPLKFFGSGLINIGAQTSVNENMDKAESNGDHKSWQDLKDSSVYDHIWTALDTGTFDHFLDRLSGIKDMDVPAVNEAFGTQNGQEILNSADKMVSRAKKIRDSYQLWQDKAPNPFNPKKFEKDSPEYIDEAISSRAWDLATKHAVFMSYSFDRTLERMTGILNQAATSKPLEKIETHDFTLLFDPAGVGSEINLLKSEVQSLSGSSDKEAKRTAAQKKKKLEKLTEYRDNLEDYQKELDKKELVSQLGKFVNATPEEIQEVVSASDKSREKALKKLQSSYTKYMRHLAAVKGDFYIDNKATAAFDKIKDFYDLHNDAENLSQVVNILSNPDGFTEHFRRNTEMLHQLYANKKDLIEEGIRKTMEKKETNALLNQLYEQGVVMESDDLEAYLKDFTIPENFYDIVNKTAISKDDPKYNKLVAILKQHEQATSEAPVPEEPVTDEQYKIFVDTGKVSDELLQSIASKVKNHETLSERESAILADKTGEINKLVGSSAEAAKDVSTATAWDSLPASLQAKLAPLWEAYRKQNMSPDTEEFEVSRVRQNWLSTAKPSEIIAAYNLDNKLRSAKPIASQEVPVLRTVTIPDGKGPQDLSISDLGALIKRLRERNSVNTPDDTQKDLRMLDIQDLEDYIVRRRSLAPKSKTAKVLQIVEKINQMQEAVEGRSEDNQFYIINGQPYSRVTSVIARIAAEYTGAKSFVYPNLATAVTDYSINQTQSGGSVDTFMATMRSRNFPEFNERKYKELESALRESNTIDTLREKINDLAYDESRKVGNTLDALIRKFLQDEQAVKPENMSQESYDSLLERLNEIRDNILDKNLTVLANNIVVYDPELKIAGEIDLLAVDKNGDLYIYDIKSSRKANWDKYDQIGDLKSSKIKHQLQVSAYGNLLYNSYGVAPKGYGIIPLEVTYDRDGNIETLTGRKTIKLEYLPEVEEAVPRKGQQAKPLLESTDIKEKPSVKPREETLFDKLEKSTPGGIQNLDNLRELRNAVNKPENLDQPTVEAAINASISIEQLREVGEKLLERYGKDEVDIPGAVIEALFEHRRLQIIKNLDPQTLKTGEVLIMRTPAGAELYRVIGVADNTITFEKLNAAGEKMTMKKDEVVTKFEGRWSKDMETQTKPEEPTKEEKKLVEQSGDLATQFLSDKTRVQQIADETEKNLSPDQSMKNLLDNLEC